MIKNIVIGFIVLLVASTSLFASTEGNQLCETFVTKGTLMNTQQIAYPNSRAKDYLYQFTKIKGATISENEKKDLKAIADLLNKTPGNQKIYHSYNAFEKSAIPAEWADLYPSLNIVMNEKAQKVYTVTDDEINFAELLKKPNPNVEFVLVDLALVKETSAGAKMGRVDHTCYCYGYHLDSSAALHCAYK